MLGDENDVRVLDAVAADTRTGELSTTATLIDHAIKADMDNDEVRLAAVRLLMGDESKRPALEAAAKTYALVIKETEWLAGYYNVDVEKDVDFIDVTDTYYKTYGTDGSLHEYDLTKLLLAGQEHAAFAVVKTKNPKNGVEMVTIATKSGVNLVKLFGLPSGAPFRVSLPADRLEEVMEKLNGVI